MLSPAFRVSLPPAVTNSLRSVTKYLPPVNFIIVHYAYYVAVCLLSAIIFWGSSTPAQSITFTDSLFLCVSAMTQAGLNTVNLSELNTWQQAILFLLMLLGSAILVSCAVVHIRKKAFERRFVGVIEKERRSRKTSRSNISLPFVLPVSGRSSRTLSRRRGELSDLPEPEVDGVKVRGRKIRPDESKGNPLHSAEDGKSPVRSRSTDGTAQFDCGSANGIGAGPDQHAEARKSTGSAGAETTGAEAPGVDGPSSPTTGAHIRFAETQPTGHRWNASFIHVAGVGARQDLQNHPRSARTPNPVLSRQSSKESVTQREQSTSKYFESDGFVGRNSQFHSLSLSDRERLGGVEYRALVLLEVIVMLYFVLWQLISCLTLGAWVYYYESSTTLQNGLNPWWVGIFLGVSAFNNNGMNLLDANMVAFQSSVYVLFTSGLLILAGNTCYPIFLRVILWTLQKLLPMNSYFGHYKATLRFLLDHPRRCYTTLFPSSHTWWLLGSLITLNGIDWVAFEVLNIDNNSIFTSPTAPRALDGLFQALAVRSGGFYVVPIANLRIGLLVLYVLMMYISVYPVTITLRSSNVYEERSLGIYADDAEATEEKTPTKVPGLLARFRRPAAEGSRSYFVRQQLRGQLAHDLWLLSLGILFIVIIETGQFGSDPVTFSVFNIVFETVSAYGTVGISTGAPGVAYSFCGEWHVLSKLILCAVMLRGRHRGLPVAIDRAVLLPGEHLGAAEEEDAITRRERATRRSTSRYPADTLSIDQRALTV